MNGCCDNDLAKCYYQIENIYLEYTYTWIPRNYNSQFCCNPVILFNNCCFQSDFNFTSIKLLTDRATPCSFWDLLSTVLWARKKWTLTMFPFFTGGLNNVSPLSHKHRKVTQCKNQLQENLFIVNAVSTYDANLVHFLEFFLRCFDVES